MDKRIRDSFEHLMPTNEQSARMWKEIEKKAAVNKTSHIKSANKTMKFAATLAMLAIFIVSIGTITNAVTGGKVVETIKEVLRIQQTSQTVSGQAAEVAERGIEVWAPDIYGMDEDHIVFGTKRGVVVYDRAQKGISATIDTQEIGCIYFDSMENDSHVFFDGENIAVYNSENGKPYGESYIYNVSESGELEYQVGEVAEWHKKWLAHQQNYNDTFDMYHEIEWFDEYNKMGEMYSRRSLMYGGCYNFLMITKGEYLLYTEKQGDFEVIPLPMGLLFEAETEQNETLPMFTYSGDNKAIEAICRWFADDAEKYAERGQIWIPGFIIRHEADKNGEHLVFGNFWSYGYLKNGNMMEEASGGEIPACFHLKERADGSYEVVSVDRARDGSYYSKDIKAFCKGYFGLASKLMKNDSEERRDAAKEYMAMYVKDNGLDIEYIKEYGWDPFAVFD